MLMRIRGEPEILSRGIFLLGKKKGGCLFACLVEIHNKGRHHTVALPFTLKSILRQKRRVKKTQIFHHAKI